MTAAASSITEEIDSIGGGEWESKVQNKSPAPVVSTNSFEKL